MSPAAEPMSWTKASTRVPRSLVGYGGTPQSSTGPRAKGSGSSERPRRTGRSLHVEVPKQVLTKTKMCKFFGVGACTRGFACTYAHAEVELRCQPDLFRTEMCFEFVHNGVCNKRSTCRFAHGKAELRLPMGSAARESRRAVPPPPPPPVLFVAAPAVDGAALGGEIGVLQREAATLRTEIDKYYRTSSTQAETESWSFSSAVVGELESETPSSNTSSFQEVAALPRTTFRSISGFISKGMGPVGSGDQSRSTLSMPFSSDELSEHSERSAVANFDAEMDDEEDDDDDDSLEAQVVKSRTFFSLVPLESRTAKRCSSCPPKSHEVHSLL